jgi:hypothetical protein
MAAVSLGNPQSNNLYAYTQNMPTDFVDPSGLLLAIRCSVGFEWRPHIEGGGDWELVERCYAYDDGFGGRGGIFGPPIDVDSGGNESFKNDCFKFVDSLKADVDKYRNDAAAAIGLGGLFAGNAISLLKVGGKWDVSGFRSDLISNNQRFGMFTLLPQALSSMG